MHAKTVWDVVMAACYIGGGVTYIALHVKLGDRVTWREHIGYLLASLGFLSWGIAWVTLPHGDVWPIMLATVLGCFLVSPPRFGFGRRSGTDN